MGGHRGTGERKAEREAKAMKVSVVILNWNGCDMLRTFLPSVVRYSKGEGVEVCVADNGSTDASVEMLRQDFPSVRVILLEQTIRREPAYWLWSHKRWKASKAECERG